MRIMYRSRGTRREKVVLAVLCGLFLMHGFAMAGAGCDGAGMRRDMPMAAMAGDHPVKSVTGTWVEAGVPPGSGPLCLANQPRSRAFGAGAAGLVMVAVLVLSALIGGGQSRRNSSRGPPLLPGSALLTRLCISRT
jgi:hypothetical protein